MKIRQKTLTGATSGAPRQRFSFSHGSILASVVLGLFLIAFVAVFPSTDHQLSQLEPSQDSTSATNETSRDTLQEHTLSTRSISSSFVRLRLDELSVPLSRSGAGGGLTSFGDDVLLLTHDGVIHLISGTELLSTNIQVPDNGFRAYKAAAESPRYQGVQHFFGQFRYNDILFYSDGSDRALIISYTEWFSDEACFGTTVARLKISSETISAEQIIANGNDWDIVYRTQP